MGTGARRLVAWSTWDGKTALTEDSDERRVVLDRKGDGEPWTAEAQRWNSTSWGEPYDPDDIASILRAWGLYEHGRAERATHPTMVVGVDLASGSDETGIVVLSVEPAWPTRAEFAKAVDEAYAQLAEADREAQAEGSRLNCRTAIGVARALLRSVGAGSPRAPERGKDPEASRFFVEVSRALSGDAREVERLREVLQGIAEKLSDGMVTSTSWDAITETLGEILRTAEAEAGSPAVRVVPKDSP